MKPYFESRFPDVFNGVADLHTYFFAHGIETLRREGWLGFIASGTFQKLSYGAPLRKHLSSVVSIAQVIEFGEQQVFSGATTYPIIIVLRRAAPDSRSTIDTGEWMVGDRAVSTNAVTRPAGDQPWFLRPGPRHVLDGWEGSRPLIELLDRPIFRGLTTGLNSAFTLDEQTRKAIILESQASRRFVKPVIQGRDLRTWYQDDDGRTLILIPNGWTRENFGENLSEEDAWSLFSRDFPAIARHLELSSDAARRRYDQGEYWWELRPCSYYDVFDGPRIFSNKVSRVPTFSFSDESLYAENTAYVIPTGDATMGAYLLGLLNSRVSEFYSNAKFAPKANGYYEVQPGVLGNFPIPTTSLSDRAAFSALAISITENSRARYALHERVRHRISTDLGADGKKLNRKLTEWWNLDFRELHEGVKKTLKGDIPLKERDEWEIWFNDQLAEHQRLTAEIVRQEIELNENVYRLFELTSAEIEIIEESTKYQYGEV